MIFKRISRRISKRISGEFFLRESLFEMRWLSADDQVGGESVNKLSFEE